MSSNGTARETESRRRAGSCASDKSSNLLSKRSFPAAAGFDETGPLSWLLMLGPEAEARWLDVNAAVYDRWRDAGNAEQCRFSGVSEREWQ